MLSVNTILLTGALILATAPSSATAEHCTTWSTTQPEIDTNPTGIGPRYYVDHEYVEAIDWFSIWWYEETNGLPGLQRADENVDDTCHGLVRGDTIVF